LNKGQVFPGFKVGLQWVCSQVIKHSLRAYHLALFYFQWILKRKIVFILSQVFHMLLGQNNTLLRALVPFASHFTA